MYIMDEVRAKIYPKGDAILGKTENFRSLHTRRIFKACYCFQVSKNNM